MSKLHIVSLDIPHETLAAFGGDELRARIFVEKYALRGPDGQLLEITPEQMWDRLAKGVASVEPDDERRVAWELKFRWLLDGFRFVPGGRIMHAVGLAEQGYKVVPINCFVLPIRDDSIDAIYDCLKEMADTYKAGGGCGVDISVLRPKGSPVHNAARTSTGAVSFMELFSLTTGIIGQSGRRGALMITIADNHPDVLDFVRVKRDLTSVRFANISVRISDAFMKAVETDGPWTLEFSNDRDRIHVTRTIRARELWQELVEGAARWAEPGCIFWDTMKRFSTTEYNGMGVVTTNPCVTGDTRVSTSEGLIRIDELAARSGTLPGAVLDSRMSAIPGIITRAWRTGYRPVIRVETREGYRLRVTPDHRVMTANRGWVPAGDLRPGDLLLVQNRKGGFGSRGSYELGLILGWLVADGAVNPRDGSAILYFYDSKRVFSPLFQKATSTVVPGSARYPTPGALRVETRSLETIQSTRLLVRLVEEGFNPLNKHQIPELIWQGTEDTVRGFLQSLFTADGTILNASSSRRSIRLTSTNDGFLRNVQILLANFGIASRLYLNRRPAGQRSLPDGRGGRKAYPCKAVHELVISRTGIATFGREIGFIPGSDKQRTLEAILKDYTRGPYSEQFTARVASVSPDGEEEVYDLTEAVSHTFIANGLTISNCAEQGLDAYNNCCLGSLNLLAFVRKPFAQIPPRENVDWDQLSTATRYAIRFLDNVQTYAQPLFPLPAQRQKSELTRRVGLGITGLGDMLIVLGLRYDSEEAVAFVEYLMEFIKLAAYRESIDLAREKGPFPLFDPDRHLSQEFFRNFPGALLEDIRKHGLRNAALMTVPPVGSGAALAGVTSGIEPVFAFFYTRRSESLSREYFNVLHPLVAEYARLRGVALDGIRTTSDPGAYLRNILPREFVTAHEIDWRRRIEMQAAIQRHVDNAISSTINLPRDTTPEQVGTIYFQAWRAGLKGITVYVEGSREGVLITPEEAKRQHSAAALWERIRSQVVQAVPDLKVNGQSPEEQIEETVSSLLDRLKAAPMQLQLTGDVPVLRPRPPVMYGVTIPQRAPEGNLQVTINEVDGEPFELILHGGKTGNALLAVLQAMARVASIFLRLQRLPSPMERVRMLIDQWEGIAVSVMQPVGFGPNKVLSFADGVAKALRKYIQIKEGAKDEIEQEPQQESMPESYAYGNFCPRCQQMTLVTTNGCAKCPCGYREC